MIMSKKEEKEVPEPTKYSVTILNRRDIITRPNLAEEVEEVLVTYVGANLAPRTINILKDEWTLEVEKARIRQDIDERLAKPKEAYKV